MKCDQRCVEGTLYEHHPQNDDPYYEINRGKCPECDGIGCDEISDVASEILSTSEKVQQAGRCSCFGSNDYCPCQNIADRTTVKNRMSK